MLAEELQNPLIRKKMVKRLELLGLFEENQTQTLTTAKRHLEHHETYMTPVRKITRHTQPGNQAHSATKGAHR
jgi:hypothetical protein